MTTAAHRRATVRDVRRATRDTPGADHRRRRVRARPPPRRARALGAGGVRRGRGSRRDRHRVLRRAVAGAADRLAASSRARPGWRARPAAAGAPAGSAGSPTSARRSRWPRSAFGVVLLVEAVLGRGALFWPLVLGVVGVALLWRQADEAQRERWLDTTGRIDPVRAVLGSGGWASYARLAAGVGLIVIALVLFALRGGSVGLARDVAVAALLGVVGLAHRARPVGVPAGLRPDRRARRAGPHPGARRRRRAPARLGAADARADPEERRRRRDGRPAGPRPGARPAVLAVRRRGDRRDAPSPARCAASAAEVEDAHGVSVEVVTRRRLRPSTSALRPVVAATREAVVNAAKHAGTGQVDVYAEVHRRRRRRVRPRPRPRLRPGRRPRRPARRAAQHHRPDGAPRRHRRRAIDARRGHRGAAAPAPPATGGHRMS